MDPELKSILMLLLDKVERIEARLVGLDKVEAKMPLLDEIQATTARLEDEQRQIKEMLGVVRLKEIGRLDGRIDQLAMDVALGRKPDAA